MNSSPELDNTEVVMVRDSLDHIPQFDLPAPYTIRWYQPGDEAHWLAIHVEADLYDTFTPALFLAQFGTDPAVLAERQAYLGDGAGQVIGTASAWFDPDFRGQDYGQIHWVAIRPAYQSLGLAKPLLTSVCNRLRDLGHRRAYLGSSTVRIPALNLYLKFGFVPEIRSDEDRRAWQFVRQHIDHPALAGL